MGVGSFDTFFKSLDDDSGKRGKQWEVACKWFLENDGAYSELEKVWLWDDWPGKNSPLGQEQKEHNYPVVFYGMVVVVLVHQLT